MGREPSPWWNSQKAAWYAWIDGRRVRLHKERAEAAKVLRKLLTERDRHGTIERAAGLTTREVFSLFVADRQAAVDRGELAQHTATGYARYLHAAAQELGKLGAEVIRPHHVNAWLAGQGAWGPTSRFNAITAVKAAYAWAHREGHLDRNPLALLRKPQPKSREKIPSEADLERWREAWSDEAGRDLLQALVESGCRPNEVYTLTAGQVDLAAGTWRVLDKIRHKTGDRYRIVHLTPSLVELTRKLVKRNPSGPIFRNSRGRPWTRNAIACRFARLRKAGKAVPGDTAYAMRHLYITDAIERGVDVATIAALVGHKDPKMILRVYSKIAQRSGHLKDAVAKIRPGAG